MAQRPDELPPHPAEARLPLFEEAVRVGARGVPGERVRLSTVVQERDERVAAALRDEDVTVERVAMNRVVATAPTVREEGDTLIIPVFEEQLVVEKRLVLKEEVRVRRRARTRTEEHIVRLRGEDVRVERLPARDDPDGGDNDNPEQKG